MDCQIIYLNNFKDTHRLTTVHVLQIGETNVSVTQSFDGVSSSNQGCELIIT